MRKGSSASFTLRVNSYAQEDNGNKAWMLHRTLRKGLLVFQKKCIVLQCLWTMSFS